MKNSPLRERLLRSHTLERFSEEISEMAGEILASGEAESLGNIRSDLVRARQRSPAAKDPCPFRKFVLRTALGQALRGQFVNSRPCLPSQSPLKGLFTVFTFVSPSIHDFHAKSFPMASLGIFGISHLTSGDSPLLPHVATSLFRHVAPLQMLTFPLQVPAISNSNDLARTLKLPASARLDRPQTVGHQHQSTFDR
ncbi:MAG: hypothetical protein ACXW3Z_03660, partial [Limisphaerales bacterium]